MFGAPKSNLVPNTADFENLPLITPNGFREYDARWLFPKEINLVGMQALGLALGTYFHEQVQIEQAESMFAQFLALNPYAPRVLGRYSHLLAEQDKWPQAIEMAERSVQLDPSLLQSREWLAKTYELGGQPEKAKAQADLLNRIKAAGLK